MTVSAPTPLRPHVLSAGSQHCLLDGAPWRRLVVLGDSIAAGVGDPTPGYPEQPWAHQLAEALSWHHDSFAYRNLGVRGTRAAEILAGQLRPALDFGPDLAVVSAGGNDMLGRSFDAVAVEDQLEGIIAVLAGSGAQVVTFSLFDLSATPFVPAGTRTGLRHRLEELAALTERVSSAHGGVFVDFLADPATADPAIYSEDKLHANGRGHSLILARMVEALGEVLGNTVHEEAGRVAHTSS